MDLPRLSKVKSGGFDMATNIMFGYSLAAGLANYYRLLPGNIKDVKAFKICAQEYGCTDMTAIVDKGFQSDENIKFIDSMEGVSVIMALRRNTAGLDFREPRQQGGAWTFLVRRAGDMVSQAGSLRPYRLPLPG